MKQDLDALKQGFDVVKIKHHNTPAYQATHVALVKDDTVFIGKAIVAPGDQFNRALGREIALGRAYHAWQELAGVTPYRRKKGVITTTLLAKFSSPEKLEEILMVE